MVAAGETMDVLAWYQTARMVNLAMNLFSSLDELVKRDKWDLNQYSQFQLELTCKFNGKAAMTTACCSAPAFTSQIPEGIDWGFAPLPKGKVATPDVQPTIAGLPNLGKEREAAWTLLKYILEGSRMANLQKRQPPIPKDVEAWVNANYGNNPNARAQLLVEGTKIARAIDPIRFHPRYNEMNQSVITPAWTEMINGRETAAQALKRIQPQLQAMASS